MDLPFICLEVYPPPPHSSAHTVDKELDLVDIGRGLLEAKVRTSQEALSEVNRRFLRHIRWISWVDVMGEDGVCLKHD